jgi:hypothetical protein
MFINEVLYYIIEIYTFLYELRKFSLKFDKFHPNSVELEILNNYVSFFQFSLSFLQKPHKYLPISDVFSNYCVLPLQHSPSL